jgi:hypothetical protein
MGSSSAGVSLIGVGVTAGTTWRDGECVRRLNARELAQTIGDREAAREVMCGNPDVFRAYNAIGRPCRLKPDGKPNPMFAQVGPEAQLMPPAPTTPVTTVPVTQAPAPSASASPPPQTPAASSTQTAAAGPTGGR